MDFENRVKTVEWKNLCRIKSPNVFPRWRPSLRLLLQPTPNPVSSWCPPPSDPPAGGIILFYFFSKNYFPKKKTASLVWLLFFPFFNWVEIKGKLTRNFSMNEKYLVSFIKKTKDFFVRLLSGSPDWDLITFNNVNFRISGWQGIMDRFFKIVISAKKF